MYVSVDDLIAEFGEQEIQQLSDRSHNNAIDVAIVARAIEAAQAQIEDYLRGRVPVPFAADAVPKTIKRATLKLARYNLYRDPTDTVRQDYKDAIMTLKDIQSGKMVLPGSEAGNQAQSSNLAQIQRDKPGVSNAELNAYSNPGLTH